MQVLAFVSNLEHVCARYRLAAFVPFLATAGVELVLEPWPTWWTGGFFFQRKLRSADAVIIQRRLLPADSLARLRRRSRALIFDFDDAVFHRPSFHPTGVLCPRRQARFERVVATADAVVAGNSFLRDQAALSTSRERIVVIPTCVNPEHYTPAKHLNAGRGVQLAWIGSSSTLRGLEMMRGIFEELGKSQPGLTLKTICNRSFVLEHLPVRFCPWSQATEAADLADADIGVSWVPPDVWSRGKCGLKVLQYMAAGLPVVANPVGVQTDLVRPGETGFLAETPEQWLQAIRLLAGDPDLRRRRGAAGRRRVFREFHVHQGAATWLDLLKTLPRATAHAAA